MKRFYTLLMLLISLNSIAQNSNKNSNEIPLEFFGKSIPFNSNIETVNNILLSTGAIFDKQTSASDFYKEVKLFDQFSCLQFSFIKQKNILKAVMAGVSLSPIAQLKFGLIETQIKDKIYSNIVTLYGQPDQMNLKNQKQGIDCNKWLLSNDNILLSGTLFNGQAVFIYIGNKNDAPKVK